jgi:hypothetical protein
MSEERSIRVIVFDGKQENWRQFKLKCLAKASYMGYRDALDGTVAVPKESDVLDLTKADDKEKLKARKMNASAYAALCLSCEGASFGCIERAVTNDLPSGDSHMAWKNLCDKYEPTTQMSMVALKKEFAECKLESVKTDPDEWITKLEHIRSRISASGKAQKIDDDNMIAHVLANLPKAYSEFVTMMEVEMDGSSTESTPVTLDKLIARLRNFYRRKFAVSNSSNSEMKDDVALSAFKGTCRKCGTYGHRAQDCRKKNTSNQGGKGNKDVTCSYCQK